MHFGYTQEANKMSLGAKVMMGGRYDDVRMCVASDAGVKGGIIADIMLLTRYQTTKNTALVFELPLMRPILFAAAFKMLQFEPQFTYEFSIPINEDKSIFLGPGIGASLHYGPDYLSDQENKGPSFFAAGPLFSAILGYGYNNSNGKRRAIGIRGFYIPLFSQDYPAISSGTVLGGVIEGHIYF